MADEVKEESKKEEPKQDVVPAPEAAQAPAVSTPAPASSPAAAPEAKPEKKAASAPVAGKGKGSRPKQCVQCSKNLKKKTWYYRDNKYFCNKNCWKASKKPKTTAV